MSAGIGDLDIDVDYAKLIGVELQSCCMPKIKDLSSATVDDIVRDLHRVLTGNGDATHGIIFKVANTNVNVRLIKRDIATLGTELDKQSDSCTKFRTKVAVAEAVGKAEKVSMARIGAVLWANKSTIVVIILVVAMYINSAMGGNDTAKLEKRVDKIINSKVEELFLGLPSDPIQLEVK